MTLRGLLVLILELILVILAFGTDFKNFLIIALCLGGLLLFSFVSLVLTSFTLGAGSSVDTTNAVRGDNVNYTFNIRGVLLLPVAVYFYVKSPDITLKYRRKNRHSFMLLPTVWVNRRFVFKMPCTHIGEWEIGVKRIRIEDLFGFFTLPIIWCKKKSVLKGITVLPKIHNLADFDERDTLGGYGNTNILNSENGELLGDARLYHEGDSFRQINWKMSARTKQLHSRMYETPQEPNVSIVMDTCVFSNEIDDIIDISCETVIALAKYFTDLDTNVRVVLARCGDGFSTQSFDLFDSSDVYKVYDNLSNTLFTKKDDQFKLSYLEGLQVLNYNKIYLVTANPSDELISTFSDINKSGRVACCILPCGNADFDTVNSVSTGFDATRLSIASPDQILKKVGEVV